MHNVNFTINVEEVNSPVIAVCSDKPALEGMVFVSFTDDIINELVREIADVKNRLLEAITNYIDGAKATIESVTDIFDNRYRKMKKAEEYVRECEGYKSELTNFTINGVSSVTYRGCEHNLSEYVRRLTENHMEALEEKINYIGIKSEYVIEFQKEYIALIKQFIQIVRSHFY